MPRSKGRSARFWVWIRNEFVKVTLTPKRPRLIHGYSQPDEEGYHSEWNEWTLEPGGAVKEEWGMDSRDCDGRYTRGGTRVWDGRTVEPNTLYPDILTPVWTDCDSPWQRDHTAEAEGY